jgi:selenocysteine-specific translation elongation factor
MILVVDIVKGIQTQTAECLLIGEILTDQIIVVLNKIDLIPVEEREKKIEKAKGNILKALKPTRFADSVIVPVSAAVGGGLLDKPKWETLAGDHVSIIIYTHTDTSFNTNSSSRIY